MRTVYRAILPDLDGSPVIETATVRAEGDRLLLSPTGGAPLLLQGDHVLQRDGWRESEGRAALALHERLLRAAARCG